MLLDTNVLIYAHREDCERHAEYRAWLEGLRAGESCFGVCDLVLSACVRVLTHPRVFDPPTPLAIALQFVGQVRAQPNCAVLAPGERHWAIFRSLCEVAQARGNLVPDAYLAALAIESGSEWITVDRDFARFPGLRWRHPLKRV